MRCAAAHTRGSHSGRVSREWGEKGGDGAGGGSTGAMKEALDPQALEDAMKAMRYGPEMKARVMALAPGTYCGTFYRRKDGTMVKYKKKLVPGLKLKHVRLQCKESR